MNNEYELLSKMNYDTLCKHLIEKYGEVKGSYFVNETCRTPNSKIKRSSEGLFVHHIKENEFVQLNNTRYALLAPYEYQLSENLLYCDYIEHMLLHMCIVKEFAAAKYKEKIFVGFGGLMGYILPEIIDYINGYEYKKEYQRKALRVIDGNEIFIIKTLQSFVEYVEKDEDLLVCAFAFHSHFFDDRLLWSDTIFKGKMIEEGRFNDILTDLSDVNWNTLDEVKERLIWLSVQDNTASYRFSRYYVHEGFNKKYHIHYYRDGKLVNDFFYLRDENGEKEISGFIRKTFKKVDIYYINPDSDIQIILDEECKNKHKNKCLMINGNKCTVNYRLEEAEALISNVRYEV